MVPPWWMVASETNGRRGKGQSGDNNCLLAWLGGSEATATVGADRASRLPRDRRPGARRLEPDLASRSRLRGLGAREAPLRPDPDAQAGRPPRSRREQLAGKRRLGHRRRQRGALRLRQGDREHDVRQSVLHATVRRRLPGRARARCLPLRASGPVERRRASRLLRHQRRRVVGRQPDAARRARHRVQPLRPHVLRPESERDGLVDRRLPQRVPGSNQPLGNHLHDHQLVAAMHGELPRLRRQPALDRPLERQRRRATGRLEHVLVLAVDQPAGRVPRRPGRLQRVAGSPGWRSRTTARRPRRSLRHRFHRHRLRLHRRPRSSAASHA